jgi:hypothetical protein
MQTALLYKVSVVQLHEKEENDDPGGSLLALVVLH